MTRIGLLPAFTSMAVAAVLAGAALVTVHRAGCSDPGHYLHTAHGIVLVGGCLQPGDLPVVPAHQPPPAAVPAAAPLQG